jgi:hypothetical protein
MSATIRGSFFFLALAPSSVSGVVFFLAILFTS